jgi:hypothetical protein
MRAYTVCKKGEGIGYFGDLILQVFNTLYLTKFRTYKIGTPSQTKTLEGRGHQTGEHLPQSTFTGKVF